LFIPWYREKRRTAATPPPTPDPLDTALAASFQVFFGIVIGLCVICAVEVGLSLCHLWIGVDLGDREPGQYCPGDSLVLKALMRASRVKGPVGDFGAIVIAAAVCLVFPIVQWARGTTPHGAAHAFAGPLPDWLVRLANALVMICLFSFWPVLDGSP